MVVFVAIRILLGQAIGDRTHISLGLLELYTRLEPRHDSEIANGAQLDYVAGQRNRRFRDLLFWTNPQIHALRELKITRHHSDNLEALIIQRDAGSDDAVLSAKTPAPSKRSG